MSLVVEEVEERPANVLEYVAAITGMPAGRFFGRASSSMQRSTASAFASPFFALSALAPEVFARQKASVVLGGRVRVMAEEGGRWLTLISRLYQQQCTLIFSVCSPGKPAAQRRIKPLLVQPPQRIVNRQWAEVVASSPQPIDALLIYGLASFDELWVAATSPELTSIAQGGVLLWEAATEAESLIVRAMLRARGFEVTEPVPFCDSPETPQSMVRGGWWLRARLASEPRHLTTEQRESFHSCLSGLRNFLDTAENAEQAAAIAEAYGALDNVVLEGETFGAVMVTPSMGIARGNGRLFQRAGADAFVWQSTAISHAIMDLMPEDDPARLPGGNRYLRMSWLGRALAGELQTQLTDTPCATAPPDATNAAPFDAAAKPTEITETAGTQDPRPLEIFNLQTAASPTVRRRARLSRGVGISNVLAIAARLGRPGASPNEAFALARREIAAWLGKKGFAIDLERTSLVTETPYGEVSIESDGDLLWSMRFDDRSQMADGAFWRVETTLLGGETTAIGLRVIQVRQAESAPPPKPGVPRVIAAIAANVGLHEAGYPLKSTAWSLSDPLEADRLFDLLCSPARLQPVIVISATSGQVDPSLDRLASRLTGVAHVVRIGADVASLMIRRLGRNLATFGNAARLYRPGFSREADPFVHPLWTFGELPLANRIVDDMAEEACVIGIQADDLDERVPSFQEVRNHIAKARMRDAVQQTEELASSVQEERDRQEAVRREIQALLDIYASENKELVETSRKHRAEVDVLLQERDAARDEVRRLKYQITAMRPGAQVDVAAEEPDVEGQYPDTWDDLETWVECFGNDRLVLLPQAVKAARESSFQDIPFAYRVLEFLVEYYVPLRTRHTDDEQTRLRYEEALATLGVELGPVGTAVEDKRYKKEYRRRFGGKEIKLDLHLKRGVGFDPATVFRLYFWYDTASERVVVGHLPGHLTNRITHTG